MKNKLIPFLGLAGALALAGCATPATHIGRIMPVVYEERASEDRSTLPEWRLTPEEREARANKRRAEYLAATPALPPPRREAIRAGTLIAGMAWMDVQASVGPMQKSSTSGGLGGDWDIWTHGSSDGYETTYLFFHDGWLVRWSKTSNY